MKNTEDLPLIQSISPLDRDRQKALRLSILLILEFFICWLPLYIYHTIGTFNQAFYRLMPSYVLDLILLLSFTSAACNPITYYFMSKRYRTVLLARLDWLYAKQNFSRTPSRRDCKSLRGKGTLESAANRSGVT